MAARLGQRGDKAAGGEKAEKREKRLHQKSNCITLLTFGPYTEQIWSRNTPHFPCSMAARLGQKGDKAAGPEKSEKEEKKAKKREKRDSSSPDERAMSLGSSPEETSSALPPTLGFL